MGLTRKWVHRRGGGVYNFSLDLPLLSVGGPSPSTTFGPPPLHVEDPRPTRRYPDQKVWVWVPFSSLRKGSSVSWSWSSREIKLQNASCQCVVAKLQGDKLLLFLQGKEWSWSYREINQHPNLSWNFVTHGFLHPSTFPELVLKGF